MKLYYCMYGQGGKGYNFVVRTGSLLTLVQQDGTRRCPRWRQPRAWFPCSWSCRRSPLAPIPASGWVPPRTRTPGYYSEVKTEKAAMAQSMASWRVGFWWKQIQTTRSKFQSGRPFKIATFYSSLSLASGNRCVKPSFFIFQISKLMFGINPRSTEELIAAGFEAPPAEIDMFPNIWNQVGFPNLKYGTKFNRILVRGV